MGLPRRLKDLTLFNDGQRYLGEVASVTLPKLTRKFENWRGGGMDAALKIDMGGEAMEWSLGGPMLEVLTQFGDTDIAGVLLRFVGAWQRDDDDGLDRVEIVIGQPSGRNVSERRMRHRRIAKIVLTVALAVVWVPIAIVMMVAGMSDRLR
jgi:P2 family phage contractile tail tube protein